MRYPVFMVIRVSVLKMIIALSLIITIIGLSYNFAEPIAQNVFGSLKQRVIVLDPGHGGIDGGANCLKFLEKDINLTIALKLKKELQKLGAKVILTRDRDIALHDYLETITRQRRDLWTRVNIIKNNKPDLFLSIHVNANPRRPHTTGPMVFYNKSVHGSFALAERIQSDLNKTAANNGFKEHQAVPGDYFILNNTSIPGAIVELGFMTNYKEKQMLQNHSYQQKLIETLSESIEKHFTSKSQSNESKLNRSVISISQNLKYKAYFPQKELDTLAAEPLEIYQATTDNPNAVVDQIGIALETLIHGPKNKELEPVLNPETIIREIRLVKGIAEVDFSKEITKLNQGSHQEYLAIISLVETVCQFPGVNGLQILIDGQKGETLGNHLDISKVLLPEKSKIKVAIVIDDLAGSNEGLEELMDLNIPLTMAVMPKHDKTRETAELVHQKGYPIFLHLPMEAEDGKLSWLGDGAITVKMTPVEVVNQVQEDLKDVPYVIGINNHMGSKVTKSKKIMIEILKIAKSKHLIILDSRTTDKTVIPELAKHLKMPILERTIFLDNTNSLLHVKNQIKKLAELAKAKGSAIAIGHVGIKGNNTARALEEMVPWLHEQGIELVYAHQLVTETK